MSKKDDDWKRKAIDHDVRIFAQRAARDGRDVTRIRDPAGRTTIVTARKRQTAEQRRQSAENIEARWEHVISTLTAGQIVPSFERVLVTDGQTAVLNAALRITEYREDLVPAVREAFRHLGLNKEWHRAQLAYIDRIWEKHLGPALQLEHLEKAVSALRVKGPGVLEAWTARVRKHRPDLWPALMEILIP